MTKENTGNYTDSEMVKDMLEASGLNGAQLGRYLGNSNRTFISNIKNRHQAFPAKYIVKVIELFPDVAKKYQLLRDSNQKEDEVVTMNEPNNTYSKQSKEKMKNFEKQLNLILDLTTELRSEVRTLKMEVELLKSNSSQTAKIG